MITKAHKPVILADRLGTFLGIQGLRSGPGSRPPGQPIQDHLQLITLPSSAHAAAPSFGAESMIEASVSASGASPVDSQFEPIQEPSTAVSFSPVTQLVAIGRRSQDQQRQDRHVPLHEFDQGIATASAVTTNDNPVGHPARE
jgi:hypothetical protein